MAAVNSGVPERLDARSNRAKQSTIKASDIQDCLALPGKGSN
jgi:hypothetical protein